MYKIWYISQNLCIHTFYEHDVQSWKNTPPHAILLPNCHREMWKVPFDWELCFHLQYKCNFWIRYRYIIYYTIKIVATFFSQMVTPTFDILFISWIKSIRKSIWLLYFSQICMEFFLKKVLRCTTKFKKIKIKILHGLYIEYRGHSIRNRKNYIKVLKIRKNNLSKRKFYTSFSVTF